MSRKSAFSHRRSLNANFSPHSTPDLRLILPASAGPGDPTGTWVPAEISLSEKDVPIMKNLKQVRKTNDPSRPVWSASPRPSAIRFKAARVITKSVMQNFGNELKRPAGGHPGHARLTSLCQDAPLSPVRHNSTEDHF